ncbi:carboxymuconolactone decarboxylase family protein [Vibrio olivae]
MKKRYQIPLLVSLLSASVYAADSSSSKAMLETVSPKMAQTQEFMDNELWKRSELSPKERSLVTFAAAIARDQTAVMSEQIEQALDNGVTPKELSETMTHLALCWLG